MVPTMKSGKPYDLTAKRMAAMEQLRAEKRILRLSLLFVGVIGFGVATEFLVKSSLGAASWNVLAEGISLHTGITFGWVTNIIAVIVLLCWIPLKEKPGPGTFLNVFLVGFAADATAGLIPDADSFRQQLLYYVLGLVALSFCCALYLGAQFGAGPRDGLMTGLVRATGKPIWIVRTVIELVVVALGFLMGGVIGVGTLLIAITMGPLVQLFSRWTTVRLARDNSFQDEKRRVKAARTASSGIQHRRHHSRVSPVMNLACREVGKTTAAVLATTGGGRAESASIATTSPAALPLV